MFDADKEKIPRFPVTPEDTNAPVAPARIVKSAITGPKAEVSVEKTPIATTPGPAEVPPPEGNELPAATVLENVLPEKSEIPDAVELDPLLNV